VILEGSRISSTRLRLLLNEGNITSINKLSARDYFIRGVREAGENIGEKIGFPTINITDIPVMLPANGVYKTRTKYRDLVYSSMSYIGSRPTFGKEKQVVETHLFNFEETVPVGSEVIIYFHEYLRADRKFDSKDELIRQLNLDRQKAMKNN